MTYVDLWAASGDTCIEGGVSLDGKPTNQVSLDFSFPLESGGSVRYTGKPSTDSFYHVEGLPAGAAILDVKYWDDSELGLMWTFPIDLVEGRVARHDLVLERW